jgi:hypothetical protein
MMAVPQTLAIRHLFATRLATRPSSAAGSAGRRRDRRRAGDGAVSFAILIGVTPITPSETTRCADRHQQRSSSCF